MPTPATKYRVSDHFEGKDSTITQIYRLILAHAKSWGSVREEAKKTSIHLVRETAFAGIATRKAVLILTLKSAKDIRSPRVAKHEQISPGRWHLDIRLTSPKEVDAELMSWARAAYDLSG